MRRKPPSTSRRPPKSVPSAVQSAKKSSPSARKSRQEKAAPRPRRKKPSVFRAKQAVPSVSPAEQEEENEDIEVLDPDPVRPCVPPPQRRPQRPLDFSAHSGGGCRLSVARAELYAASAAERHRHRREPHPRHRRASPLQLLAMLIGVDIFSMGFSELLHGRPCPRNARVGRHHRSHPAQRFPLSYSPSRTASRLRISRRPSCCSTP